MRVGLSYIEGIIVICYRDLFEAILFMGASRRQLITHRLFPQLNLLRCSLLS